MTAFLLKKMKEFMDLFSMAYFLLNIEQKLLNTGKVMGQQQLLLIVLALIIVGIAIAISVQLFRANAVEGKRDILIEETTSIGVMALQYFKKPQELGGGGKSFLGFSIPPQMVTTVNGNFMTANIQSQEIRITGTGSEVVTGGDSIKVETVVTPLEMYTVIIN